MKNVWLIVVFFTLSSLYGQDDLEMGKPDLYGSEFQKRFVASYGVLEDREPELQELEISLLEKIGPMVEENPEFAKSMLEGMLGEDNPASATFNFILANLYFNGDALEDAMDEYDQAIEKYPAFRRAWKNLGMLKVRNTDYEGGLEALVRCIELGDTSPDTYGTAAYCHLRSGNLMAAELAYNAAIVLEPRNIEWLEGRVQAMIQGKRFQEAVPLLGDLIDRNPKKDLYRTFLANVYVEQEDFLKAAETFEVIHALGKGNSDTRLQLANIYSVNGFYELAVDTFMGMSREQLELRLPQALLNVNFLLEQDESSQARRLFEKIGSFKKDWSIEDKTRYRLLEAGFATADGDDELAYEKLFQALEDDPLNGHILIKLGSLHADRKENAKAMFYFERAYGTEKHEYDALLLASQLLIDENRFSSSMELLKRAQVIRPSNELVSLITRVRAAALQ